VPAKLGLSAIVTAIFTYGFQVFLRTQPSSDITAHIDLTRDLRSITDLPLPHFLFQVLLKGLTAIGIDYTFGAALLLGLCYGGMAFLIAHEIERRGARLRPGTLFVVPTVLVASHIFLLTAFKPNLYFGYFVPIAYHSATQQLNKLFALWIFFAYAARILEGDRTSSRGRATTAVLCVLSALAKPSFLLAFLPATGLTALRDIHQRRWRHVGWFLAGVATPTLVVMLVQAWLTYGPNAEAIDFQPFTVFDFRQTLYKLPLSMAFPLIVAVAAWRHRNADSRLRFIWLYVAIALFATLCLVERGRLMSGNFAWTGQTAVFLAYVESALFLLTTPLRPSWRRTAWAVFGVHVACGVVWYAVMFWPQRAEWL
jgi:hypothetical protein